jgi:hypothetical protein
MSKRSAPLVSVSTLFSVLQKSHLLRVVRNGWGSTGRMERTRSVFNDLFISNLDSDTLS